MKKNEWVSITDKQPKFGIPVLCCSAGEPDSVLIKRLEIKVERKDSVDCFWLDGVSGYDESYTRTTHWMPLPEAAIVDAVEK